MRLTLLAILMAAVVADFREMKISNRLIAFGLFLGLAFRILVEGSAGIVHFLVNISIPVILLFFLFQMRALGAGDIKLFSVAGGFLAAGQLFALMTMSFLAAGVIGIAKLLWQRATTGSFGSGRTLIHFSLAILIGYFVVVWGCAFE